MRLPLAKLALLLPIAFCLPSWSQIATAAWIKDLSTIITPPSYGGKGRPVIIPAFGDRIFVFGDKAGGGQVVLWIDKDATILHREDLNDATSVWSNPVDKTTCIIDIARTANYSQELWRIKDTGGVEKQLLKQTATNLRTSAETLSGSLDSIRPPHPQNRFYLLTDNCILTAYDVTRDTNRIKLAATMASGSDGNNLQIHWFSSVGESYQIQKSENLDDWSDIGTPITGTGASMNYLLPMAERALFLRVIIK